MNNKLLVVCGLAAFVVPVMAADEYQPFTGAISGGNVEGEGVEVNGSFKWQKQGSPIWVKGKAGTSTYTLEGDRESPRSEPRKYSLFQGMPNSRLYESRGRQSFRPRLQNMPIRSRDNRAGRDFFIPAFRAIDEEIADAKRQCLGSNKNDYTEFPEGQFVCDLPVNLLPFDGNANFLNPTTTTYRPVKNYDGQVQVKYECRIEKKIVDEGGEKNLMGIYMQVIWQSPVLIVGEDNSYWDDMLDNSCSETSVTPEGANDGDDITTLTKLLVLCTDESGKSTSCPQDKLDDALDSIEANIRKYKVDIAKEWLINSGFRPMPPVTLPEIELNGVMPTQPVDLDGMMPTRSEAGLMVQNWWFGNSSDDGINGNGQDWWYGDGHESGLGHGGEDGFSKEVKDAAVRWVNDSSRPWNNTHEVESTDYTDRYYEIETGADWDAGGGLTLDGSVGFGYRSQEIQESWYEVADEAQSYTPDSADFDERYAFIKGGGAYTFLGNHAVGLHQSADNKDIFVTNLEYSYQLNNALQVFSSLSYVIDADENNEASILNNIKVPDNARAMHFKENASVEIGLKYRF